MHKIAAKAAQSEGRAAEENRSQREGHQSINMPVEDGSYRMESRGHSQQRKHRKAVLAVFDGQRHRNHEHHAGKFQRADIN
jgi:hypothetical protein